MVSNSADVATDCTTLKTGNEFVKTIAATEAKNKFGMVMDSALVEPVLVQKSGRSSVIILSIAEYERLTTIEDAYWAARAVKAEASGFASEADVKKLIEHAQGA